MSKSASTSQDRAVNSMNAHRDAASEVFQSAGHPLGHELSVGEGLEASRSPAGL